MQIVAPPPAKCIESELLEDLKLTLAAERCNGLKMVAAIGGIEPAKTGARRAQLNRGLNLPLIPLRENAVTIHGGTGKRLGHSGGIVSCDDLPVGSNVFNLPGDFVPKLLQGILLGIVGELDPTGPQRFPTTQTGQLQGHRPDRGADCDP